MRVLELAHSKQIMVERARELRRNQTPAEVKMWRLLRSRRLLGYKFKRQHVVEHYVLDFYCAEARLAIELDGSVHVPQGQCVKDRIRQVILKQNGIEMIHFWNNQVCETPNQVLDAVYDKLITLCPLPKKLEKGLK